MNTKIIIIIFFFFTFLVPFSKAQKTSILPAKSNTVTAVPLYRLVDPYGYHFYTTNEAERNATIKDLGYKDEGVLGYVFPQQVPGTVPLLRYRSEIGYITNYKYGEKARIARHFYTINGNDPELKFHGANFHYGTDEKEEIRKNRNCDIGKYVYEGIQCYIPNMNTEGTNPVFRLRQDLFRLIIENDQLKQQPGTYDNLYTISEDEKFTAIYKYKYIDNGVVFYVWKTATSK